MSVTATPSPLPIGKGQSEVVLYPKLANRHGLISGATGTGKTISLQVLAEGFSALGVPVFLADVKGDLAGISQPGVPNPKLQQRIEQLGIGDHRYTGFPVAFWDVFGEQGLPLRATVSDMGPLLLSRLLDLNEVQSGLLSLVFRVADEQGLLLLDLKDLRAMLRHVADNAKTVSADYGHVSTTSVAAIQRQLLTLEEQGGEHFFGEPALRIADLLRRDESGRGMINLLAADKLIGSPLVYSTLLLWLLAELFEQLPEVGDPERPKLVFFFDEAHLLFKDTPKALQDKIEQVVRLIRSKGVGVYFVTQTPMDIPDSVLGQLGNRIQHALRAFTPRDQKAVRAAAETFRGDGKLDVAAVITELGVGEALVSCLDPQGSPQVVQRALIRPPQGLIGPIPMMTRDRLISADPLYAHYKTEIDRESAYELLKAKAAAVIETPAPAPAASTPRSAPRAGRGREGAVEAITKSAMRAIGSQLGRQIMRGILGAITGGRGR